MWTQVHWRQVLFILSQSVLESIQIKLSFSFYESGLAKDHEALTDAVLSEIVKNQTTKDLTLVLAVAGVCFFLNLGGPHLWDRDETRNAGCAAEMFAAGDWIVPTFNAELREHKPVLTYWFMMLSYTLFGVTEFAARLPSAIYGLGTVSLTYFLGARLFGRGAGLWAAIGLSTSMMFGVASRAATPDAPLIFFTTLAISIYVFGTTTGDKRASFDSPFVSLFPTRLSIVVAMYAAMGMAVLAKGPIGLILPTAIIGMFLLIKRLPKSETLAGNKKRTLHRLGRMLSPFAPMHFLKTCWSMRPITAIFCTLVIALPWYVLVHMRTDGEWTYGFFIKHNLGRAVNSMDGHRGNFLFYPASVIVGFFPFSIFWLPALLNGIRQLKIKSKLQDGYLFAFCWVGVYLALFSLAKTKLPSYVTPCYPGVALTIGVFVSRWSSLEVELSKLWSRLIYGSLVVVGVVLMIALPIVAHFYVPEEKFLGLLGLIPLCGGLYALVAAENLQVRKSLIATGCTSVMISTALFAFAADRVDEHRHLEQYVELINPDEPADRVDVFSYAETEASWVFYARQPVEYVDNPRLAVEMLLGKSDSEQSRVLVTSKRRMAELKPFLPTGSITTEEMPYFMEDSNLIIARPSQRHVQVVNSDNKTIR